ncbi:MAG: MraY family glycosyltransferase [Eggerthellales bacterium]|nr:MraY family glycosyltransferase [Eggerthellales bacterium]
MEWYQYAAVCAVACATTIALVPAVRVLAFKLDAVDYPSERRVNKKPMARMGGLAMFGGMACALLFLWVCVRFFGWKDPFNTVFGSMIHFPGVFLGIALMFFVGFLDDVKDLKPIIKLFGQILAASIVAACGLVISSIHNPFGEGYIFFGIWGYPLTVFYLIAFTNVINLIDGLDGLASGITVITTATMFVFALLTGRFEAAIISIALIGACMGFLRYNFHPASIFMGDSGSHLLGFTLGIVSLLATTRSVLFVSLLLPIIAAGVPIIDTAAAIIRRVRGHQPIQQADKGHIHHRLLKEGFSQRTTVLIMWGWTLVLAVCAIFITEMDNEWRIPFIVLAIGVSVFFVFKLNLLTPTLLHHYNPRPEIGAKRARQEFNRASDDLASRRNMTSTDAAEEPGDNPSATRDASYPEE